MRRPVLIGLLAVPLLAGCANRQAVCPLPDEPESRSEAAVAAPKGCQMVATGEGGVATLVCDDGREGFMVSK